MLLLLLCCYCLWHRLGADAGFCSRGSPCLKLVSEIFCIVSLNVFCISEDRSREFSLSSHCGSLSVYPVNTCFPIIKDAFVNDHGHSSVLLSVFFAKFERLCMWCGVHTLLHNFEVIPYFIFVFVVSPLTPVCMLPWSFLNLRSSLISSEGRTYS